MPTLFTVGEFDESDQEIVRRQAARVPDAKFVVIPNAAHVTTWDAPEENVRVVRDFLREVDRTRAQSR